METVKDYREVQMLRLAVWSEGILTPNEESGVRNMIEDSRIFNVLVAKTLGENRDRIINQFEYTDVCIDLGAMIGSCTLCDHAIRYEFVIRNRSTRMEYVVGSDCIVNYINARLSDHLNLLRKRAAEKRKKNVHRDLLNEAFNLTNAGETIRDFIADVARKFERYGSLTPGQERAIKNIIKAREGMYEDNGYRDHN